MATNLATSWQAALTEHQQVSRALANDTRGALAAAASAFDRRAEALVQQIEASHAHQCDEQAQRDSQRLEAWRQSLAAIANKLCATLDQTAQGITTRADAQTSQTIAEITRVLHAASEAPRVAAEVIAEMRQRVSDSVARDTAALEERNRLMQTLGTLLDAVNRASNEQRQAIDALVESTAGVLDRVSIEFSEKARTEAGKLAAVADQVTGSAVEVASLADAFGVAVQLFGQSSDKLMVQLSRVEASLTQTLGRSDEQLAYYVAQARELIDLSVMSQRQIIDDLQALADSRRALANAAA
jgi:hypothetical protein